LSAIGDTSINFSATIDKDGTGYCQIQAENEAAPTVEAVSAANHSFAMTANSPAKVTIGGLKASTAYRIYFVAKNSLGEAQAAVQSLAVTTAATERGR